MANIEGVLTGIDIVDIERFKKVLDASGKVFLERVFLESELSDIHPEHLAGIFAAKEAVKKAFGITDDIWKKIEVRKRSSRKPEIVLSVDLELEIISTDVSISHDGGNAIAVFVALIGSNQNEK